MPQGPNWSLGVAWSSLSSMPPPPPPVRPARCAARLHCYDIAVALVMVHNLCSECPCIVLAVLLWCCFFSHDALTNLPGLRRTVTGVTTNTTTLPFAFNDSLLLIRLWLRPRSPFLYLFHVSFPFVCCRPRSVVFVSHTRSFAYKQSDLCVKHAPAHACALKLQPTREQCERYFKVGGTNPQKRVRVRAG